MMLRAPAAASGRIGSRSISAHHAGSPRGLKPQGGRALSAKQVRGAIKLGALAARELPEKATDCWSAAPRWWLAERARRRPAVGGANAFVARSTARCTGALLSRCSRRPPPRTPTRSPTAATSPPPLGRSSRSGSGGSSSPRPRPPRRRASSSSAQGVRRRWCAAFMTRTMSGTSPRLRASSLMTSATSERLHKCLLRSLQQRRTLRTACRGAAHAAQCVYVCEPASSETSECLLRACFNRLQHSGADLLTVEGSTAHAAAPLECDCERLTDLRNTPPPVTLCMRSPTRAARA